MGEGGLGRLNIMAPVLVFATNPAILRYAQEALSATLKLEVLVFNSLCSVQDECSNAGAVILGPQFLAEVSKVRARFPQSFILGISDWSQEVPADFHQWGNQLRDLATPFVELLDSWIHPAQEQEPEA